LSFSSLPFTRRYASTIIRCSYCYEDFGSSIFGFKPSYLRLQNRSNRDFKSSVNRLSFDPSYSYMQADAYLVCSYVFPIPIPASHEFVLSELDAKVSSSLSPSLSLVQSLTLLHHGRIRMVSSISPPRLNYTQYSLDSFRKRNP
jgi:hypothetical protein